MHHVGCSQQFHRQACMAQFIFAALVDKQQVLRAVIPARSMLAQQAAVA